jgi:hypothetical protein
MKTHVFCTAVVCTLAFSGLSLAQERRIVRESVFIADRPDPYRPTLTTPYGLAILVGGGITDFSGSTAQGFTDPAGMWRAAINLGTRTFLGFELAYVGSSQDVQALGLDQSGFLLQNGGEGLVKLNLLPGMWQPYVYGGAGWSHYSISNEDFNTSAVEDTDNVATFPIGGGLGFRYEGLVVDGRGQYKFAVDNELFGDGSMNTWGANLNVGWEF